MKKRITSTLYMPLRRNPSTKQYEPDEHGYLFSRGIYRTKILPSDLPDWYVYGYIHRQYGYISAKGVCDLLFRPSYQSVHLFKDDLLFVSYKSPIEPDKESTQGIWFHGYDHIIFGSMIIPFLEAVKKHSAYDTSEIMLQIERKKEWYSKTHSQ